jgi:methylmalonyl-CoA/ethylmalonyl-CoA epimerase
VDPLVFDHVGIVVADADKGCKRLAATLSARETTRRFDDAGLGVSVRFLRDGSGLVYELIAPFGEASPVARTLASKANLLNQIAYRTRDIAAAATRLRATGNFPLGPAKPAIAFGGASVQFFMGALGFVIELIEGGVPVHEFMADRADT